MVQKYQNEIAPIFYYGISTKTNKKDLKIPNLQAMTLGRIIKMTLYIQEKYSLPRGLCVGVPVLLRAVPHGDPLAHADHAALVVLLGRGHAHH